MELLEVGKALGGSLKTLFLSLEGFTEDLLSAREVIVSYFQVMQAGGLGKCLIC